jgi:hypothetical protein
MFKIHNKTLNDVVILNKDNQEVERFRAEGPAINLGVEVKKVGTLGHVPLIKTKFKDTKGLPPYKEGVYYIVSQIVKSNLPHRKDLLVPAEIVVRNETKRIVGCRSLEA